MYLIVKGKSLKKGQRLWRGFTALPGPLLPKRWLHNAARANTTFLRLLSRDLSMSFVAHDITAVSKWYDWLDSVGCTFLSEVDCKDQFYNVHPIDIHNHLSEGSEWLSKRKHWCMSEIIFSVSRDSKKWYTVGRANSTKFWFITHAQMTNTIEFKMEHNNFVRAAVQLWCKQGCIPMGGSFFAQAANLHSLWSAYTSRRLFYALG